MLAIANNVYNNIIYEFNTTIAQLFYIFLLFNGFGLFLVDILFCFEFLKKLYMTNNPQIKMLKKINWNIKLSNKALTTKCSFSCFIYWSNVYFIMITRWLKLIFRLYLFILLITLAHFQSFMLNLSLTPPVTFDHRDRNIITHLIPFTNQQHQNQNIYEVLVDIFMKMNIKFGYFI